ncbi:VC0807 family protein [Tenggerimyces flavus]|uniref:VC0807 family protein n=1 Tax=Tenggerimyces flavus TaxID=1708749 RepID=A0ABV7Y803_9ACTN|nr:VC0807 family protein [Tenggerimyces flavus]MBM7786690.1 flagellar biogenesis protein FliO [Tenggerimyces flavus]
MTDDKTEATATTPQLVPTQPPRPVELRQMVVSLVLDIGLALGTYYGLRAFGVSMFAALLAATVVAGIRVVYVAARGRSFDPFAIFLLGTFGIGLILSFFTGDARFLLAKDSAGGAIAGLWFIASCFIGRPLIFFASRRFQARTPEAQAEWDGKWRDSAGFRSVMRTMSAVWGVGLVVEAAIKLALVYTFPVDVMVAVSAVMGPATFGLLILWTVWYVMRIQRKAAALEAAEAAAKTAPAPES